MPELEQSFGACLLEGEERLHNLAHSSARRLRMIARSDLPDESDVCPFGGWERRPPAGGRIEIGGRSIAVLASTND